MKHIFTEILFNYETNRNFKIIRTMFLMIKFSLTGYGLALAILDDYAVTMAKITGEEIKAIKERILSNSRVKMDDLRINAYPGKENE